MSLSNNFPAIKPSLNLDFANTKRLDPRVTFTRSTTGTYYDGVTTAMAEQNLMVYSQSIGTSPWNVVQASIALNTVAAPDGTTTASTLTEDSTAGAIHLIQAITNAAYPSAPSDTYTVSIYAKQGSGSRSLAIALPDAGTGGYAVAVYDFATGTVTYTASSGNCTYLSSSMTSVGSGWYRCVLTGIKGGTNFLYANIALSDSTTPSSFSYGSPMYNGNGTSSIYLWGCQIEQRSSVTAYTATTTQPITNYIPVMLTAAANVPRFDHNPTTDESLGLLIEEQRTNLLTYSAQFDNAAWVAQSVAVTANAGVAPDGTTTADKLAADSTSSPHALYNASALTLTAAVYTWSIFVKAAGNNFANLTAVSPNGGNRYAIAVDLTSGTVTQTASSGTPTNTSSFVSSYGNGWYRIGISMTASSNASASYFVVMGIPTGTPTRDSSSLDPLYTGNGFNGIFIWGAQLESGSFATSYIPTTSAAATRAEDGASMTGINLSSWFNNAQGTLYIDGTRFGTNLYPRFAGFYSGNTESYSMGIGQWSASTVSFYGVNGTVQFDISRAPSGLAYGSQVRAAGAYAVNNVGLSANGTATSVDTDATIPYIDIFWIGGGVNPRLNGWLKKVAYYPVRVTDAQLQALSS